MHHHARQRLPSHTHYLLNFQTPLSLPRHSLTRHPGTARAAYAYATISSATMDDAVGREKEAPPRPKNPYPYPTHPNPTPYQIFHLPMSASQAQIKARYFELVRAHHPDAHHAAALSAELAHARFRTIKAAYDFLAGRTLSPHPNARPAPAPQHFDPYMHELARRRRAYYAAHGRAQTHGESGEGTGYTRRRDPDDGFDEGGRKERLILAFGVLSLVAGLFPMVPGTLISALLSPFISDAPTPAVASSRSPADTPASTGADSATASAPIPPGAAATPAGGMKLPLIDLSKGHREAVSALVQVRSERAEMGVERREGVRRRVREMHEAAAAEAGGGVQTSPPSQGAGAAEVEPMGLPEGASVDEVDEGTGSEPTPVRAIPSSRDGIMEEDALVAPPSDTTLEPGGEGQDSNAP
ncbi:hypothetical protein BJ912DRAFT_958945 [Pholiota molesta]|nr:hypothetical protein BJ912DRAFT_958945 [Pholiota molesta]